MPRGGFKHGGGRPPGSLSKVRELTAEGMQSEQVRQNMTPLEYMLHVMNDPVVDPVRRDRMAAAAAPFVHPKADTVMAGKKQAAEEEARTNDQGTEWFSLLNRNSGKTKKDADPYN